MKAMREKQINYKIPEGSLEKKKKLLTLAESSKLQCV